MLVVSFGVPVKLFLASVFSAFTINIFYIYLIAIAGCHSFARAHSEPKNYLWRFFSHSKRSKFSVLITILDNLKIGLLEYYSEVLFDMIILICIDLLIYGLLMSLRVLISMHFVKSTYVAVLKTTNMPDVWGYAHTAIFQTTHSNFRPSIVTKNIYHWLFIHLIKIFRP